VGCYVADWVDCVGTVNVTVASTEVFSSTMTTDWVFVRTVAIVIQPSTTNCTLFPITVEAVVMTWNIADCIKSFTFAIVIVATIRNTLLVVAISVQVSCVTNLASLAVFIGVASTTVIRSSVSTDGMRPWTVVVCGAAYCAVCCRVTVEAVVVGRDVTSSIMARTLGIIRATLILDAPAAVVAMVSIGAVAVFNALRRTFVIHTGLPRETIARARGVSTVAIIVNGPDTGGAFWPEVEFVVEGVCPLVSLLTLALVVTVRWIETQARTTSALKKASLVSWATLPEAAAVL